MKHPLTAVPDSAYNKEICLCEYSSQLKEWIIHDHTSLENAFKQYDEVKTLRPVMILNFGNMVADNETNEDEE